MTEDIESLYAEASALHSSGTALSRAETLYRALLTAQPRHAAANHQLGALLIQMYGKEKYDEARRFIMAAVQLQPASAKFRHSLGVVHQTAGRWPEAVEAFERANEKDPLNVTVLMNLARALREAGRQQRAAEVYGAVVKIQPDHPSAHYRRGAILRSVRRNAEALASFRQHLRLHPDHQASTFWIAALLGDVEGMAAAPPDMVAALFDQYADHFDDHLVNKLQYRTPEALRDQLLASCANPQLSANGTRGGGTAHPKWRRCVDLGCGTGLMGPLMVPYCARLEGVDLSAGMVDQAAKRGCYQRLAVSELVGFLEKEAVATTAAVATAAAEAPVVRSLNNSGDGGECCISTEPYDLFVAADVFVYIGDLLPVMRAAAAAAAPGAVLAFSIEALEQAPGGKTHKGLIDGKKTPAQEQASRQQQQGMQETGGCGAGEVEEGCCAGGAGNGECGGAGAGGPGLRLQVTGRYAHTEEYLRRTGAECGWEMVSVAQSIIRYNGGEPIWGHLCVMKRPV